MTKFLIVMADGRSGRGSRGLSLYWFLSRYHGRAVRTVDTADLGHESLSCDVLFLGLPSEITMDQLAKVRYRHLVLFDYQDTPDAQLDDDRQFLTGLTKHYLKPWNEQGWPTHWTWGVLPIRRQARLPLYLRYLKLKSWFGARPPARTWDVSFLGAPTGDDTKNQRVSWMMEIKSAAKYTFWGGLASAPAYRNRLEAAGIAGPGLLYEGGRVNYMAFFDAMRQSKAVLTPMGNARWSYRHYEAIYAGAIPVSCDMRTTNVLIPLPLPGIVNVPDGASVLPGIDDALRLSGQAEVRESNIAFLERYLEYGDYSRRKPELLEAFMRGAGVSG